MDLLVVMGGLQMDRFSGYLTSTLTLLALAGCNSPTNETGMVYEASARVSADTVFWELTVTNRLGSAVTLTRDNCHLLGPMLRVYDSAGVLRFDEVEGRRPPIPCFSVGRSRTTIAPMEEHLFARAQTTEAILADSLPTGTYTLTVGVEFEEDFTGRPEIPVGEFHLRAVPAGDGGAF